ncbi:amidohydrolase [Sandaracinobacteroides sp. A072]|uniref:amidohydrolase n=1 Tax=Sandaracinobacteroides sp. A072 TaxID=3461146 RepID=UPI00404209FD
MKLIAALALAASAPVVQANSLSDSVAQDLPSLVLLYKDLHRTPELGFQEVKTAQRMAAELKALGVRVTTGVGGTGVVGVLENGPGPVLLLRTDMDGLPVEEQTGLAYASTAKGKLPDGSLTPVMHACGHDIHMTVWTGTARRLVSMKDKWRGTVVFVAQPAEELGEGARRMLEDGLYSRFPKPTHALAIHDNAALPAGMVSYTPGYAMANVDTVDVTLKGVGGHGAYPALAKDPIVLAARTIMGWQTLVSRENDPLSPAVVTVGAIAGGTTHNVIDDEVKLKLTVRSYEPDVRERLLAGIERIARGEAESHGLPDTLMPEVRVKDNHTPAVFNTPAMTRMVVKALESQLGSDRVVEMKPVMGGEDFSRYWLADKDGMESMLFWVGAVKPEAYSAAKGDIRKLPSIHSPFFAPDPEPTIRTGVEALTAAALSVLEKVSVTARARIGRQQLAK